MPAEVIDDALKGYGKRHDPPPCMQLSIASFDDTPERMSWDQDGDTVAPSGSGQEEQRGKADSLFT